MKSFFQWKQHPGIGILFILAAFYIFMYFADVGCFFQNVFGVPCPGCGMTRALISALKLDVKAALEFHPMVFSLPLIAWYIFNNGRLFKNRKADIAVLSLIGIGFIICYIIKLKGLT